MYLIRELMYYKPGKVRPLVQKFLAMDTLGRKSGMPAMKVMEKLMEGYHDLVDHGRREIYKIEA